MSMMDSSSLPYVDITCWITVPTLPMRRSETNNEQKEVATAWDRAMHDYGFAVVIGHGVDESTFEKLNEEARSFFSKPLDEKMTYNHGSYGHPNGGYTPPGYEQVALSMEVTSHTVFKFDPVENFVFRTYPNEFFRLNSDKEPISGSPVPSAQAYFLQAERLLNVLHHISACALHLEELDYFQRFYDPKLPGNETLGRNGNSLRLAHYPGLSNMPNHSAAEDTFDGDVRYGAHTDYLGFTILRPDKRDWHRVFDISLGVEVLCGGLEAQCRNTPDWIQVKLPLEVNALIVNTADLFQRWTSDRWHSPVHRVVNPSIIASSKTGGLTDNSALANSRNIPRQAIIFFSGPLDECLITPVSMPDSLEAVPESFAKHYDSVKTNDYFLMKIDRTNKIKMSMNT